jgi:hypothetical protein
VETPNLTALRAAVDAGLGLTCRTPLFLRDSPLVEEGLPDLPNVSCILQTAPGLEGPTGQLAKLAREVVASLQPEIHGARVPVEIT